MTELDKCPKCGKTSTDSGEDFYKEDIYMLQYKCECGVMWYAIYRFEAREIIE